MVRTTVFFGFRIAPHKASIKPFSLCLALSSPHVVAGVVAVAITLVVRAVDAPALGVPQARRQAGARRGGQVNVVAQLPGFSLGPL